MPQMSYNTPNSNANASQQASPIAPSSATGPANAAAAAHLHHHQRIVPPLLSSSTPTPPSPTPHAQQQYCLKWNNHTNNMVKVFTELLGDEYFVDVTLACEGSSLKAHKLVLSACSTYFRDLLINNPCKHPIVILNDMRFEDLQAIINFMYSGEVNVSYAQLGRLLKSAEALKVKGLTDVSEKHGGAFGLYPGERSSVTSFVNGTGGGNENLNGRSPYSNGNLSDGGGSNNGNLLNRIQESMVNNPNNAHSATASIFEAPYMALMNPRFKKKRRRHGGSPVAPNSKANNSAMALASILASNGNLAAALGNDCAAVNNNLFGNNNGGLFGRGGVNGKDLPSSTTFSKAGLNQLAAVVAAAAAASGNGGGNGAVGHNDEDEDNNESGDEVNSSKRTKDSNSSNDSGSFNEPKSPFNNSVTSNNTHLNSNAGDHDGGSSNIDPDEMNGDNEHGDRLMMMNESDDEFYTDVKPIVSLDESPSPTYSNMDESFNQAFGQSMLEGQLGSGLPSGNMQNAKVCVCHLCHLTFTAYSSLRRHMTRHYADRERYECDICLKSYSRKDYLKEHKKLKHSDVAKSLSAQKKALKQQQQQEQMQQQAALEASAAST